MQAVDLADEDPGDVFGIASHETGNVMAHFRKSVYNDENRVVTVRRRQVRDEIHRDVLPRPFWNWERL